MTLAHRHTFSAIGTEWCIDTALPLSSVEIDHIDRHIDTFDRVYSRFRDDSIVSQIHTSNGGNFMFPDNFEHLHNTYTVLEKLSAGAINPLVGASLESLGYDASYSLQPSSPVVPQSFRNMVTRNGNRVQFNASVLLDVGAIGKGLLIDEIAAIIRERHDSYIVDGSGDIAIHTDKIEVIGLEHPFDSTKVIGTMGVSNKSLCASATNRRAWGAGLHHIIDARTGMSTDNTVVATWAVADNTLIADALTTGLFFVDPDVLKREFGEFHHVVLYADQTIRHNIDSIGEVYI